MRICFVNPPGWVGKDADGRWTSWVRAGSRWPFTSPTHSAPDRPVFGGYCPAPLFLQYAASYARKHLPGAHVAFRDSLALRDSYRTFFAWLKEGKYDLAVIESATPSWEHDRELIRLSRTVCPRTEFVLTGPIASAPAATQALEEGLVVAAVQGEYEKGVVRVANGERGVLPHDFLTRLEMDNAPPPWLDWTHAHRYCDHNPQGQKFPHLQTWTSRGCSFKCVWCVWPAVMTNDDQTGEGKRTVRYYSEDVVAGWVGEAVQRFGFRSVYDDSDTFNLGNKHTEAMCRAYKSVGVPWSAMCRADTIKADTWGLMRESGCFGVKLGIESGSQYVLDKIINKHLNLDTVRETVALLKKLGMTVHGTFSFGNPGETREQMDETRAFIEELKALGMDTYQASGVAEIEGTPLSNLTQLGFLNRYPGAKIDDNYRREIDGNVKMQKLVEELRDG